VLIVTAHPDDESTFAATVYKITHDLKGTVDVALITNGEAGFKYSTLAEAYYGLELTDEAVGRKHLPTIRKKEMMAAGSIIGIGKYFFFDERDNAYTLNVDSVLRHVWNVEAVERRLKRIMDDGGYDLIFCQLPTEATHGHHKGAAIIALSVVNSLPHSTRPVILAVSSTARTDTVVTTFSGLSGYPLTAISSGRPRYRFDRTTKFGFRDRLDYRIIVNWLIAEHKSQGTLQSPGAVDDFEEFWSFDLNDPERLQFVQDLFVALSRVSYPNRKY